jgi:sodium/potassium/calcium exchanger 6
MASGRESTIRSLTGPQCRFVHKVPIKDQCAYIRSNCPNEEAGLISYLQLYYCSLPKVKAIAFIILVIWIGLLFSTIGIAASDFLCINLSTVASLLGMSESLTGVTFLAFGNGSPDVFSTFAAMNTHSPSLAVGELFGAAGFITAVVAASMALVNPFQVARKSFVRDVGFFVVAASFSMVFLVDGKLQVWECAVMVAFYVFYVIFVVSWHWYLGRRRRRRAAEIKARLLYHIPQTQELDVPEYRDDSEDRPTHESTNLLADDGEQYLSDLEGATTPTWQLEDIGDDDEARDRYLADLRSGMHIRLARRGERRSTITPIRPSLMGVLEFRAVLNTLHRKGSPIDLRRYSDDHAVSFSRSSDNQSIRSHPELPSHYVRSSEGNTTVRPALDTNGRMRAVSADNALGLRLNTNAATNLHSVAETAVHSASPLPRERDRLHLPTSDSRALLAPVQSPQLLISPPENSETLPQGLGDSRSPQYLMPPRGYFHQPDYQEISGHATRSPGDASPMTQPTKPRLEVPKLILPVSDTERNDSTSPFPMYTDSPAVVTPAWSRRSSIHIPEPSMSPQSAVEAYLGQQRYEECQGESHRWGWWPYAYLPAPWIIASTLFPTVYGWHDKSLWDKLLGIVSAPSVLLLAATLPVVECEQDEKVANRSPSLLDPANKAQSRPRTQAPLTPDSPHMNGTLPPGQSPSHPHKSLKRQNSDPFSVIMAQEDNIPSSPKDWNRWLVFLQIFTAPLFVVTIAWTNLNDDHDKKTLLILVLSSFVFSLVCLLLLLATTTPDHPPKYRPLFCFLGFTVAIAWISTIANEVVCVLKAFGVILGISDAILGLTIFAVGASLGDLVADITVAKLGYPVMALSACFGGPMLNILLGIGLSGLYVTIRHGTKYHAKHPDRPTKYKPFEVEVSTTLVISGVTLLTTLVGLLIVVPLNGWRMDRKVGWGLIALWSLSTIGNVVVEILGYGGDLARSENW